MSSKCHSAQAPVSLARVTSYNYNYNYNQPNCARVHPYSAKVNKCKSLTYVHLVKRVQWPNVNCTVQEYI